MKIKLILFLSLFALTSCVTTEFISYKSLDNLIKNKNYYKVANSKKIKNLVEIGISTIYSGRQHTRIVASFKNKETDSVSISSSNFGSLKQLKKGSKNYFTEDFGTKNFKKDTLYLKYPDKTYTFYINN